MSRFSIPSAIMFAICVQINRILIKLCRLQAERPVMTHRVFTVQSIGL